MTDRAPIDCLLCGSDAKIRHEDGGAGMRHAYVDAERAGVAGWNTLHARRTNQPSEEHEPCCHP